MVSAFVVLVGGEWFWSQVCLSPGVICCVVGIGLVLLIFWQQELEGLNS